MLTYLVDLFREGDCSERRHERFDFDRVASFVSCSKYNQLQTAFGPHKILGC